MKRNRHHNNPFARRLRRLGLNLHQAARWLREPYGSVKNWNQGRHQAPRSVFRLLAVYRLSRWGEF